MAPVDAHRVRAQPLCRIHRSILQQELGRGCRTSGLLLAQFGHDAYVDVVDRAAALIDKLDEDRVLVAVDGPDAAGKTTFADRLGLAVRAPTFRVSVDWLCQVGLAPP